MWCFSCTCCSCLATWQKQNTTLCHQSNKAEVGGSVVRAVGLMRGNTERDGCGGSNAASRTTWSGVRRVNGWVRGAEGEAEEG